MLEWKSWHLPSTMEAVGIPRSSSTPQRPGFGSWPTLGQPASLSWDVASWVEDQEWSQSQSWFAPAAEPGRDLSALPSCSKPSSSATPHPVSSLLLTLSFYCLELKNPNWKSFVCTRVLIFYKTRKRIVGKHFIEYIKGVEGIWTLGERVDPVTAVTSRILQKRHWASSGHCP